MQPLLKLNCRLEIMVVDVGIPADWVKVNVQRMVSFPDFGMYLPMAIEI